MKLHNKSKNGFTHTVNKEGKIVTHSLGVGEIKDIPDDIAKIWLRFNGIVKYADPQDVEKLKAENEKLKAQAKNQNKAKENKAENEKLKV